MAIRDAFDGDFSNPAFVDGTLLVSPVAWPGDANSPQTFYFSKRFAFPEGDYQITVMADDGATVWIGTDALSTRMVVTSVLGQGDGTGSINVHIPQGDYRVDVLVQNVPPAPNPAYFALNFIKDGVPFYLSNKDGWYLDDAPISDDDLPPLTDSRFSLPVFTVLPNWDQGVTERLSWLTDITNSEADAEQRRSVRRHPRRTMEANFLRQGVNRAWLDTFMVGVGKAECLVPVWHEQTPLLDGLAIDATGVTFVDGNTAQREFNTGDLVLVNNGDPRDYDLLQVGEVDDHRFSWAKPPQRAWPVGTRIFPLRTARMIQDPVLSNVNDRVATVDIRFDYSDPDVRPESWGASVNGEPLFALTPDWSQDVQVTYTRLTYSTDNSSAPVATTQSGTYTTTSTQFRSVLYGRDMSYAFRQFLASARGKCVHFQCPTFTSDVLPIGDILADTTDLIVENMGYWTYMTSPEPLRLTLMFEFYNAPPIYRQILTGYAIYKQDQTGALLVPPQIAAEVLSLDSALPAIALKDLQRISFVCETRFDLDDFELHHVVADQGVIELSLQIHQGQNPRQELNP